MNKKVGVILLMVVLSVSLVCSQEKDEEPEGESTTRITVYDEGSAFWELETRFKLKNEEDRLFFEEYVGALEEEKAVLVEEKKAQIGDIIEKVALTASRSMAIKNLDLNYGVVETINGDYGVVTFQFLWEGFAKKEGDTLRIGDVFAGGYYLEKDATMILEIPPDFIYTLAYPPPDETRSSALIWYGPKRFGENEPSLRVERYEGNEPETAEKTTGGEERGEDRTFLLIPILLVVGAGAVFFILKRRKKEYKKDFVSDEDLIIEILEKNNGRYPQHEIVKETGFSKSKISQLLSKMEEEGFIRKEKRGRENLILLRGSA